MLPFLSGPGFFFFSYRGVYNQIVNTCLNSFYFVSSEETFLSPSHLTRSETDGCCVVVDLRTAWAY